MEDDSQMATPQGSRRQARTEGPVHAPLGPAIRTPRIVVAITGATGACYGVRALEQLRSLGIHTHLIMSPWARRTIALETGLTDREVAKLAGTVERFGDQGAAISSGSFDTLGMIVAPCSAKTLAAIASGHADDLVSRAADVALKERRPLVLLFRETPLNLIHIENMARAAQAGAVVMPPVPAFYNSPRSIDDIVDYTVVRALDQFGIHQGQAGRWSGFPDLGSGSHTR